MDIKLGQVVAATGFRSLVKVGEPELVANDYSLNGADELCFLNTSASSLNRSLLYRTISRIAENCFVPLTVGGGIRKAKDVANLLSAGADKVVISSAGVLNLSLVSECAERYGSQCVVASVDCKAVNGAWEVYTHGGTRSTGVDALECVHKSVQCGAGEVLLTSIDENGARGGYDLVLLRTVSELVSTPVIASGEASDLVSLALAIRDGGASAVLLTSLLHRSKATISQIKCFLGTCGVMVRDDYLRYGLYDE